MILAYRENVEAEESVILDEAKCNDVVLLVVGDPLGLASVSLRYYRHFIFSLVQFLQSHNPQLYFIASSQGEG